MVKVQNMNLRVVASRRFTKPESGKITNEEVVE
jgi:hypothetical protein